MAIIIQYTLQYHISRNEDTKENIEDNKEHNMFKFSKRGGGEEGRCIENNPTTQHLHLHLHGHFRLLLH